MIYKKREIRILDDLDHLYNNNIYLPARMIYIGGDEIDYKSASGVIKAVHILEEQNAPINVILNNPGGDEYHGFAIYDVLLHTRCKVFIKVYGHAMSMASIILQAGDKRLLSAHSTLLIHDGTMALGEMESKSAEKWGEESKRLREMMYKVYQKRMKEINSKITIEKIQQMCIVDNILSAKKAVKIGLADGVMREKSFKNKK